MRNELEQSLNAWEPRKGIACAVLMSGGVDSAATACLLRERGADVAGFTMRIPLAEAAGDARFVDCDGAVEICRQLGIPHYFIDIEDEFRRCVIDPFVAAYRQGRTPNPCVDCNPAIKFGELWKRISAEFPADFLATGHYARIMRAGIEETSFPFPVDAEACMARAVFHERDQSYFLYRLPRELLPRLIFPLGEFASKEAVRAYAEQKKLHVAQREDSMEICFLKEGDYRCLFVEDEEKNKSESPLSGKYIDSRGQPLGEHGGIEQYTVGQRKLGRGFGQKMYVIRIDPAANTVTIGPREEAYTEIVQAGSVNIHLPEKCFAGEKLRGKIRSGGEPKECEIISVEDDNLSVKFLQPVFAPTPGQHLVLYDENERLVAGGAISGSGLAGSIGNA